MADPLSNIGSSISSAISLARFILDLKNTPTDVKTCLDLLSRVNEDLQDLISLRSKHLKQLSTTPDNLKRLFRIIVAANESILDVGRLLEGCRAEANGGQVPLKGRMKWVLGDSTAFMRRTGNLQQQHAAINVEIQYLRQLELNQSSRNLSPTTVFENPELFSLGRRRSSSKLSVSGSICTMILLIVFDISDLIRYHS